MLHQNPDNLSTNSFSLPGQNPYQSSPIRSPNYSNPFKDGIMSHSPSSVSQNINLQVQTDSINRQNFLQQSQQPPQTVLGMTSNPVSSSMSTAGRVIQRNYLQIQGNNNNNNSYQNKSSTLNASQLRSSNYTEESLDSNLQDPKRAKSISRSLRSLFIRPTKSSSKKRDKSYDASNQIPFDAQSGK